MNSHHYAHKLNELADFLLAKPEFDTSWDEKYSYISLSYFGGKDAFLGAVKAIGSGRKQWEKDELIFHPAGTDMLKLHVARSLICRKVQDEKWECEPLLSTDEEAEIGGDK